MDAVVEEAAFDDIAAEVVAPAEVLPPGFNSRSILLTASLN